MGKIDTTIHAVTSASAPTDPKRTQLKRYLKPLIFYGSTIFLNAALSFGTFALLTHYLDEVDYGIISLYNSFILLLMPFISVGVPFVLSVDYFKMDRRGFALQVKNALLVLMVACVLFTLLSLLLHNSIERFTKVNLFFAVTAALTCLLLALNDIILSLLRNQERYTLFAGFSVGKNLVEVGLTILLVVFLGYNWTGRLASNLGALVLSGTLIFLLLRKASLLQGSINRKAMGAILLAGLPFVPERLALFAMGYSDRFFIDHFSGTADVGFYSAGAQLAMVVNLSILTLNNTFHPKLFKALSKLEVNKGEIRRVIWMYIGISVLVTMSVIAFIPFFFQFFIGPDFQPGKVYAIYLTIAFLFWAIYNLFLAFLLNQRKNRLIMWISIFGMMLSVVCNYISISAFGALGAAYTAILVYFAMAVITLYFAHKFYNLRRFI